MIILRMFYLGILTLKSGTVVMYFQIYFLGYCLAAALPVVHWRHYSQLAALQVLCWQGYYLFFPSVRNYFISCCFIGMSAMFAGASRALLTSIIFALEATGQSNALLPLLAACIGFLLCFFFPDGKYNHDRKNYKTRCKNA